MTGVWLLAAILILLVVSSMASAMTPFSGGLVITNATYNLTDLDSDGFIDTMNFYLTIHNNNWFTSSTANVYGSLKTIEGLPISTNSDSRKVSAGTDEDFVITMTTSTAPSGIHKYRGDIAVYDESATYMDSRYAENYLYPIGSYGVDLTTTEVGKTAGPGETAQYTFDVKSLSDNNDTVTLTTQSSLGWTVTLDKNSIFLNPDQIDQANLTVNVPLTVTPSTKDTTTITATSTKDATKKDTLSFDTNVAAQVFSLNLTSNVSTQTKKLGEVAAYTITVKNTGNFEDTISLDLSAPTSGWTAVLSSYSATLPRDISKDLTLTVNLPSTYTGIKQLVSTITGTCKDGVTKKIITVTTVIGLPDLVIANSDITVDNENPAVGDTVNVTVRVHNTGTINATNALVRVTLSGNTKEGTKSIPAQGQMDYLFAFIPSKGLQTITAIADPSSLIVEFNETNNQGTKDITVRAADLTLSPTDITFAPIKPNGGDNVAVHVVVHNSGTVAAKNLDVALSIDGAAANTKTISSLANNGGTAEVVFNWVATVGTHAFAVTVDPANAINEVNEDNNNASATLSINAPPIATIASIQGEVIVGQAVTLDASGSSDADGTIVQYFFDFGDGTNSSWVTTNKVTHVYGTTGSDTLKVKVKDNDGAISAPVSLDITVKAMNNPPTAVIKPITGKVYAGATAVAFDASTSTDTDGTITQYLFDFGDGTNSSWISTPTTAHTYTNTGSYTITVKVKDNMGAVSKSPATLVLTVEKKVAKKSPGFDMGAAVIVFAIVSMGIIGRRKR